MNSWNEFRSMYAQRYGPTTSKKLSEEYKKYKKSGTIAPQFKIKSPVIRKGLFETVRKSPVKQTKKINLNDIKNLAKGKRFLIVVLYSPACVHCKTMMDRLGEKMVNTDRIRFYTEKDIDDSLKEYFPKVMYFENGEILPNLTVDNVYDFLGA